MHTISSLSTDDDPSRSITSAAAERHAAITRPLYKFTIVAVILVTLGVDLVRTPVGMLAALGLAGACGGALVLDARERLRWLAPALYIAAATGWLTWASLAFGPDTGLRLQFAVLVLVVASAPWPLWARIAAQLTMAVGCVGLLEWGLTNPPPTPPSAAEIHVWYGANTLVSMLGMAVALGFYRRQVALAEARLAHDATHDVLTGLANRRKVRLMLLSEVERAIRRGDCLAVVACDIDHFKRINDALGHAAGDDILRAVAERLLEATRTYDCVARVGGEEFLLVLPGCDEKRALMVAERARTLMEGRAFPTRGILVNATMSFGVSVLATAPKESAVDTTLQEVLEQSDAALYSAKAAGRNRVVLALAGGQPSPDMVGGHA